MMENEVKEKIDKIIRFKKENSSILIEWKNLIDDAKDAIFQAYCIKEYLDECEPWYCSFRMTDNCKYPEEISKLEELTRIK